MELDRLKIALESPRLSSPASAWIEHIPFSFALVDLVRPRTIVELGVHMGDSYCAFCQAVDTLNLETRCAAVDTWSGDSQAGGYDSAILDGLRAHHDPRYGRFSRLIQSTFDETVLQFQERSIDLLHIDGLHSYEAVCHDFETWLPKVSDRGVILFHDTQVRNDDFGVNRLWDRISKEYPAFEFTHGYGLGVLAVGGKTPGEFMEFLAWAGREPQVVRQFFSAIGRRIALARGVSGMDEALRNHRRLLSQTLAACGGQAAPESIPPAALDRLLDEAFDLKQWMDLRSAGIREHSELVRALLDHLNGVNLALRETHDRLVAAQNRSLILDKTLAQLTQNLAGQERR